MQSVEQSFGVYLLGEVFQQRVRRAQQIAAQPRQGVETATAVVRVILQNGKLPQELILVVFSWRCRCLKVIRPGLKPLAVVFTNVQRNLLVLLSEEIQQKLPKSVILKRHSVLRSRRSEKLKGGLPVRGHRLVMIFG